MEWQVSLACIEPLYVSDTSPSIIMYQSPVRKAVTGLVPLTKIHSLARLILPSIIVRLRSRIFFTAYNQTKSSLGMTTSLSYPPMALVLPIVFKGIGVDAALTTMAAKRTASLVFISLLSTSRVPSQAQELTPLATFR
jgi:hypothetical protein